MFWSVGQRVILLAIGTFLSILCTSLFIYVLSPCLIIRCYYKHYNINYIRIKMNEYTHKSILIHTNPRKSRLKLFRGATSPREDEHPRVPDPLHLRLHHRRRSLSSFGRVPVFHHRRRSPSSFGCVPAFPSDSGGMSRGGHRGSDWAVLGFVDYASS